MITLYKLRIVNLKHSLCLRFFREFLFYIVEVASHKQLKGNLEKVFPLVRYTLEFYNFSCSLGRGTNIHITYFLVLHFSGIRRKKNNTWHFSLSLRVSMGTSKLLGKTGGMQWTHIPSRRATCIILAASWFENQVKLHYLWVARLYKSSFFMV